MAVITQQLKLDVNKTSPYKYKYLYAKQADDNSRYLNVRFMNGNEEVNIPSGSIVTLRALKPDGTQIYNNGTVESDGTVTVELTAQVLAVVGIVNADISTSKNGEILSTVSFGIHVEAVPAGADVVSTNEFLQLTALIEDLQDLDVVELQTQLDDLQAQVDAMEGSSVPTSVRNAILALFEAGAYAETGLEDEIAVIESWATEVTSLELSAETLSVVQPSTGTITATVVPSTATVTWSSSDTSIATVVGGVVTGVSNGTCNITASAGDLSARCTVTVSGFTELVSISAVYTQSDYVFDTDSLDSLKADLVVTATYSDSSTETVASADYTLSGTLATGTSTIAVTYRDKGTTFNVTVIHSLYPMENGTHVFSDNNARSIVVTDGNHFKYTSTSPATSGTGAYVNLSKISENGTSTSASNIYTTDEWFTIPSGATYTATLKNISLNNLNTTNYNVSLRNASGTEIINFGDRNSTTEITKTGTVSADTPVTTLGLYARNSYGLVEADFELYVNGERWV